MKQSKTCAIYAQIDKKHYEFYKFDIERRGVTGKAYLEAAIEQMKKLYENEKSNIRK